MSVFVCEDRTRFLTEIERLSSNGRSGELSFKLRPRERAPLNIVAAVGADVTGLRWVLRPASATSAVQH